MNSLNSLEEARNALAPITQENYFDHGATRDAPLTGVWSKSSLHKLVQDPLAWFEGPPFKVTAPMKFGSMVDDYLFWPSKFREKYAATSDCPWNKNPGKQEYAKIKAQGKEPMKPAQLSVLRQIENRLMTAGGIATEMLSGEFQVVAKGVAEVNYTSDGKDKALFIPIKCLLDSLLLTTNDGCKIIDLKCTGAQSNPDMWKIATKLGYHWQDELYSTILGVNGHEVESFQFVFAQVEPPHRIQVAEIDGNLRAAAREGLTSAFSILAAFKEGWEPKELYPNVLVFGRENPWLPTPMLPPSVTAKIKVTDVHFHGDS